MHFELANGVISLRTVDHLLHLQRFRQWMSAINGAISTTKTADCFSYGECFTATIPLHAVTKLDVALQAILWLIKARERRWNKGENDKRKKITKGERRGDSGEKKKGERVAPALPTPSWSAHHLLRPAATAITHHKHTSTAQRRGEKERDRGNERGERRTEERTQWEIQEKQKKGAWGYRNQRAKEQQ